jgi:hypothetical protein
MDLELLSERELVMELVPLMGTKLARDLVDLSVIDLELLSEMELVPLMETKSARD